jgi:hypothetical protein
MRRRHSMSSQVRCPICAPLICAGAKENRVKRVVACVACGRVVRGRRDGRPVSHVAKSGLENKSSAPAVRHGLGLGLGLGHGLGARSGRGGLRPSSF